MSTPRETTVEADERETLRDRYEGLRVTDVVDGLDAVGYADRGQYSGFFDDLAMDRAIRPLFRDTESFSHRVVGFAHTVRLHPTNGLRKSERPPSPADVDAFDDWKREWYDDVSAAPRQHTIRDGDLIVIEAHETEVGYIGSQNLLGWVEAGAVGVVTNGGCRDTDELVKQGHPVYSKYVTKTNRPGRLETDATNVPVNVGGTLVRPDDLVVADGDGVVVVPLELAQDVADVANEIRRSDQRAREGCYGRLGIEKDRTLDRPDK